MKHAFSAFIIGVLLLALGRAESDEKKLSPLQFNKWDLENCQDYFKNLAKKYGKLSATDIKSARERAEKARAQKNYGLEAAELERILSQAPTVFNDLIAFCLAKAQSQEHEDYRDRNIAIQAYTVASTPEERAKAVLLLAHFSSPYQDPKPELLLAHLTTLMPLSTFREKFPDFNAVYPFKYEKFSFDTQASSPTVCFSFSQSLDKDLPIRDFITLSPEADIFTTVRNEQICIRGLEHGKTYSIILKAGLKSQWGEVLAKEEKLDIYVPDDEPRLSFPTTGYVLKKGEKNFLPISTVNLKDLNIKIYKIPDRAVFKVRSEFLHPRYYHDFKGEGKKIYEGTYEIIPSGEEIKNRNKTLVTNIDLNSVLKEPEVGIYAISAEAKGNVFKGSIEARQWFVVTDIGLTTYKGEDGLYVDTRSLTRAKPFKDIKVDLISETNEVIGSQISDKNGLVHFPPALLTGTEDNRPLFVLASSPDNKDFSLLYLREPAFDLSDRGVSGREVPGSVDAYVYADRGVYRGGETVHLNMLVHDHYDKALADLPLTVKLLRPDGQIVTQTTLQSNRVGHSSLDLPLLPQARTGKWEITVHLNPNESPIGRAAFQVEDFVPVRLLIRLKTAAETIAAYDPIDIDVEGRYLFGSFAANLSGKAAIALLKHPNPFPQYKDFSFGLVEETFIEKNTDLTFAGLDEKGIGRLQARIDPEIKTTHPLLANIYMTILDPSGRNQFGNIKRLALLQPHVIGIRPIFDASGLSFNTQGADFEIISLNSEGHLQAEENLEYELFYEERHYTWFMPPSESTWVYRPLVQERSIQTGVLSTKADEPICLKLPISEWGSHRLVVRNPQTGAASSLRFAKGCSSTPENKQSPHRLSVTTDKNKYRVGETVHLHIVAPFDGEARLIVANHEVIETKSLPLSQKGTDITLKAEKTWGKGAYIIVNGFRPLTKDTVLPKRAIGLTWVPIDRTDRLLNIDLKAPEEIKPKQTLTIPIHVTGGSKKDLFITLAAVDEGILQLTDYVSPAPQDYFFTKTKLGVEIHDLYGRIIDPQEGLTGTMRSGGDMDALSRNLAALSKRSFKIVSLYKGPLSLDSEGKGSIDLDIPEFNGKLRLMAVAFDAEHIGSTQTQILVREPVVTEIGLPRFLHEGDTFTLPITIYNTNAEKGEITVNIEAKGSLTLESAQTTTLKATLSKDEQKTFLLPCKTSKAGDGQIHTTIQGPNNLTLEQTQDISVQHKNSPLFNSRMLSLKPGEIFTPEAVDPQLFYPETLVSTVSLYSITPWNVQVYLQDLVQYPFGCIEQLTSRGFAHLALIDKDEQQKATEIANCERILKYLSEAQLSEGNFNLWLGHPSAQDDWLTAYVFHFIQSAKKKGLSFSPILYKKNQEWLQQYLKRLESKPQPETLFTAAYVLYLLAQEDAIPIGDIRYFYETFYKQLPTSFAKGLVIATLARIGDEERCIQAISSLLERDPKIIDNLFFGSPLRNEAGLLTLLLEIAKALPNLSPIQDLIAKQVQILSERIGNKNESLSTNEKAWLILASEQLLSTGQKNDFTCEVSGKEIKVRGIHTIPIDQALKSIKNTSDKSIWIGINAHGISKKERAADKKGMSAKVTYHTLKGDSLDPQKIKSGESFVVVIDGNITEASPSDCQLLIVDRLPAGLEIDNPHLSPVQIMNKSSLKWLTDLSVLNHQEIHDDRFIAALTLKEGQTTFKIAYGVRATLPGTYLIPELTAEDLYAPSQRYFRTATGTLKVVA